MDICPHPTWEEQGLTLLLFLGLTAPEEDRTYHYLIGVAERWACYMDATAVERCKAAADERAELCISGC